MAFLPHDRVIWRRVASGGYGFAEYIPAVVVRVGNKRVTVDADLYNGDTKRVAVRAANLQLAPPEHAR